MAGGAGYMTINVQRSSMATQKTATFAQRLAEGREQSFVGRAAELLAFDSLFEPDDATRLWFITGSGGIGKSTLLQVFCTRARARGIPLVFVDARGVRSTPPDARNALERAAGNRPLSAFCAEHPTPILLIDTFENWVDLEWWLREHFLPEAPSNLRVIVAGRDDPEAAWTTDPGWRDLIRVTALEDLSANEAGEYLTRRGISGESRQTLLDFSAGRPLVLALGADMVNQGQTLQTLADTGPIIEHLVKRFTSDARHPDQRQALDATAIVRTTNKSLLAGMLDIDDAGPLYEWLSGLSFMESGPDGIFPHDQVRETLILDMARRFPDRYETGVLRAFDWIVKQIEAAEDLSWAQAARLAGDGMYALRELKMVQHFLYPKGVHSLYIEPATSIDWPILADMVAYHEGWESRSWFEFWCQRAPASVFVVRDPAGTARGLFMRLDMETLSPEDRRQDPLTDCLWEHLAGHVEDDDNVHLPFIRFWLSAGHWQSQSPEKTAILMAINSYNLMAKNLRLTAQVFRDSPEWVMQAKALGIDLLANSDTPIGETTWRIYYNDWQKESSPQYYRHFAERCIAFDAALANVAMPTSSPTAVKQLDEAAFQTAVADALKHYHSPSILGTNPLLGSALVLAFTERGTDKDHRIQILRQRISQAVDGLPKEPGGGMHRARLLQRTYLDASISQKQIASTLGIGYSTYRRHLAEARKALITQLWQTEIAQR